MKKLLTVFLLTLSSVAIANNLSNARKDTLEYLGIKSPGVIGGCEYIQSLELYQCLLQVPLKGSVLEAADFNRANGASFKGCYTQYVVSSEIIDGVREFSRSRSVTKAMSHIVCKIDKDGILLEFLLRNETVTN